MYDFSGIVYRIWGVSGVLIGMCLIVIILIFLTSKNKEKKKKECMEMCIVIVLFVIFGIYHICLIQKAEVESYSGEFVEYHRNGVIAPPLPLTAEYVFWNGEGKKQKYYLDLISKKKYFHMSSKQAKITLYTMKNIHMLLSVYR